MCWIHAADLPQGILGQHNHLTQIRVKKDDYYRAWLPICSLTLKDPKEHPKEEPRLWSLAFTPLVILGACTTELHIIPPSSSSWWIFIFDVWYATAAEPKIISLIILTSLHGGFKYLKPTPSPISVYCSLLHSSTFPVSSCLSTVLESNKSFFPFLSHSRKRITRTCPKMIFLFPYCPDFYWEFTIFRSSFIVLFPQRQFFRSLPLPVNMGEESVKKCHNTGGILC